MNQFLKRFEDLFACLLGLFIFTFPFACIAIAIKLDDGGSIFFIQERVGLNRVKFRAIKFRTMEKQIVTRVGFWLRKSGLDELPQFINIFKGEMSVVGPRPLTEDDIVRLGWDQKNQFRWHVKPGMTGLAQIYAGHSARRSLACDRLYTKKAGVSFDVYIMGISFLMNCLGKNWVKKWVLAKAN